MALVHSLLAAGIQFALFPASPTPFELKHLAKVSKVKKVFTSLQNLESARIVAREAGFSESDGIFILEGEVKGRRSFDDLVRSVREPAKGYAKPVGKDALAYLVFSSGTTGLPKGEGALVEREFDIALVLIVFGVSSGHDDSQKYHVLCDAGVHHGCAKQSSCTGELSSSNLILWHSC